MVEMAATAGNYKTEVVNANKTSTNNYKMEVVAAQEKKVDKKDKKEKISKEKEIKEEEKPKATIQEEKPLPRLPCSGSSWCNILCGAGAGSGVGVRAAGGEPLGKSLKNEAISTHTRARLVIHVFLISGRNVCTMHLF